MRTQNSKSYYAEDTRMKLETIIATRPKKTVYRDGDVVIKLFNEDYSKSDILNEALNQARVEETGLAIPKILEITKIDGKWAIISEYIEGPTLEQLMIQNPDKMDEYLDFFVTLQTEIHQKKAPLLTKLLDKMNRKINQADIDHATKYDLHTALEGMHKHDKVLHGDFNPSNIVMGEDGKAYILDWAHATQGNASADAARTYLVFNLAGKADLANKYLDLFCAKSGINKRYVQRWLPIVAASQSVKAIPEEKELLNKWINVFDYE